MTKQEKVEKANELIRHWNKNNKPNSLMDYCCKCRTFMVPHIISYEGKIYCQCCFEDIIENVLKGDK